MKKSFFDYRQNINFEQFIKTQIHVLCRWCFITVNTVIIKNHTTFCDNTAAWQFRTENVEKMVMFIDLSHICKQKKNKYIT